MKIYITGLPSGYEVEHLVRLFYPMAPLTLTPPEERGLCLGEKKRRTASGPWCGRAQKRCGGSIAPPRGSRAARRRSSALPA